MVMVAFGPTTSNGATLANTTVQIMSRTASNFKVRVYHGTTGGVTLIWFAMV